LPLFRPSSIIEVYDTNVRAANDQESGVYSISYEIPAPIEFYDVLHAAITAETDQSGEGLLVHIGRTTDRGFQIIEVWESKEHFDTFTQNTLPRALAKLPMAAGPFPALDEFELRGFLVYTKEQIIQ
jgi:hypothetical protein